MSVHAQSQAAECGKDADNFEELSCMLDVHCVSILSLCHSGVAGGVVDERGCPCNTSWRHRRDFVEQKGEETVIE
eukprot:4190360-Amphidinium_carterae.1